MIWLGMTNQNNSTRFMRFKIKKKKKNNLINFGMCEIVLMRSYR